MRPHRCSRSRGAQPPRQRLLSSLLLSIVLLAALVTGAEAGGRPHPTHGAGAGSSRRTSGSGSRSTTAAAARTAAGAMHARRLPTAWGETWEFEEDVLEPLQRLGTRVLDFVLRRQPPEEPHPLRMQRWTIYMRKFPFRSVVRHMQFYADGTCEVEEEIIGGWKPRAPPSAASKNTSAGSSSSSSSGSSSGKGNGKRRRKVAKGQGGDSGAGAPLARGKWKYDKYGLNWELDEGGLRHFYHAELIWHSFGDRPKMHCGVIVRNRGPRSLLPPWLFRPVVGTFHALGSGVDTYAVTAEANDNRFANY